MKKLSIVLYVFIATALSAWICGEVFMKVVLPLKSSQYFLQQRAEQILGRSVRIGHIGLGWTHFKLDHVRVESARPAEEKSFLSVKRVRAYWSFWALLRGQIKIYSVSVEKPTLHLVHYEDGTWNISDWQQEKSEPEEQPTEENFGINFYIRNFQLTDGELQFTDLAGKQIVEISKLYLGVHGAQTDGPFAVTLNAGVLYTPANVPTQLFKIGLSSVLHLKAFNKEEMSAEIRKFLITHPGGKLILQGKFYNALKPNLELELTGKNISEELVSFAASDVPDFSVKKLEAKAKIASDLQQQTLTVHQLKTDISDVKINDKDGISLLQIPQLSLYTAGGVNMQTRQAEISTFTIQGLSSVLSAKGRGQFNQKTTFSADGNFDLDLKDIGQAVGALADYHLAGHLQGTAQGTQADVSGKINALSVGGKVPGAGNLSDINFTLTVPDKDHAQLTDLTGKINGGDFTGNLTAARTERGIELDLKASSPRVALPSLSKKTEKNGNTVPQLPEKTSSSNDLPPFYVKAAIDINSLDAPFMYGENIAFKADLEQLTSTLDKTSGTLSLNIGNGEIKDLAQLTSANILTGVLFGSLDVVGKVINSLNVLAVLDVFSGKEKGEDRSDDMVVQTIVDENGEEQHILVPYEPAAYSDIWQFKSFGTDMKFQGGVGDITKGLFRSDRMSFNLTGDMDFNTRKLDMTVQAAPGLHEEDGIMPLSLKIGGTIEDPKGSMSMLSSVTSALTQSVTNNFASRTVKKSVSGFFGLFKKKESPLQKDASETAPQQTDTAE